MNDYIYFSIQKILSEVNFYIEKLNDKILYEHIRFTEDERIPQLKLLISSSLSTPDFLDTINVSDVVDVYSRVKQRQEENREFNDEVSQKIASLPRLAGPAGEEYRREQYQRRFARKPVVSRQDRDTATAVDNSIVRRKLADDFIDVATEKAMDMGDHGFLNHLVATLYHNFTNYEEILDVITNLQRAKQITCCEALDIRHQLFEAIKRVNRFLVHRIVQGTPVFNYLEHTFTGRELIDANELYFTRKYKEKFERDLSLRSINDCGDCGASTARERYQRRSRKL